MQEILTPRLTLRRMTEEFLEATLAFDFQRTQSLIGFMVAPDWFEQSDLARRRLDDYRSDPSYQNWGSWAVGLNQTREMVGHIGFHTAPNPEYLREMAPNSIELGYTIYSQHRRQGMALEAVMGLMRWAIGEFPLENFVVSVSPQNTASTALAQKLKFRQIGQHIDEVDGLELIYALPAPRIAEQKLPIDS